jgi:parallel beta-helix repeat protein
MATHGLARGFIARIFVAFGIFLSVSVLIGLSFTETGLSASGANYTILGDTTGGDCPLIGTWDSASYTCYLGADMTDVRLNVYSNDVTVDGQGHTLNGAGGGGYGVYIDSVSNVTVRNLVLTNFSDGIFLAWANHCRITANTTSNNGEAGIGVWGSNDNIISGNTVANNGDGIDLVLYSGSNTVSNNTISGNQWGVWLAAADGNLIYNNNFISNTVQADGSWTSGNTFNLGQPIGGNYWNNWIGPDANGDGFVDAPYIAGAAGTDNLAWVAMNGWCGNPQLSLSHTRSYWPGYSEYQARELSVDYSLANSAAAEAYGVQVVGTIDTNDVHSLSPLPVIGSLAPNTSASMTIVYHVPPAVFAFNSRIYVKAYDSCGGLHAFPGPWSGE